MTTTTLPNDDGWLLRLGQLAELLVKPFVWVLAQPRLMKVHQVMHRGVSDFGSRLIDASDAAELHGLVEEVAMWPDFGLWLADLYEVAALSPAEWAEHDRESTVTMARSLFHAAEPVDQLHMGHLMWVFARLQQRVDHAALRALPSPLRAAWDLACPSELADLLGSGRRLEASTIALVAWMKSANGDWRGPALIAEMGDNLRQVISLLGHFADDEGAELLRTAGIEPAPVDEWLAAYRAHDEAIDRQVHAAKAGIRRPFA